MDVSDAPEMRDYSTAERAEMAKKGWAMPDGSFPINNAKDLDSAIHLAGHSKKYSEDAIRAHIIKNAKRLGLSNMIPDDWKSGRSEDIADRERRTFQCADLEIRGPDGADATGGDWYTMTGYAAVFNSETVLRDNHNMILRERIMPGAFTDVLKGQHDVHLLINHNTDKPMARTGVRGTGSLELSQDDRGLRIFARLNPRVQYIRDLAELMRDGVVDQMSFAFNLAPGGDEFRSEEMEDGRINALRSIHRVKNLFDVTVTPQGAYSDTSAALRSLARSMGRTSFDVGPLSVAPDDLAGGLGVAPDEGTDQRAIFAARSKARARALRAVTAFPPR